jgi:hypothetical protein
VDAQSLDFHETKEYLTREGYRTIYPGARYQGENMKATLEFNLPEDDTDFQLCSRGSELFLAIWDLLNNILSGHGRSQASGLTADEREKFRTFLMQYLKDENLLDTINHI